MVAVEKKEEPKLSIDLGCGKRKREGFIGLDQYHLEGVDHVLNLGRDLWPFDCSSVDEAHSSHFVEHLTSPERCHFFNELWRVMKKDAKTIIIIPHWSSSRAYGDPTHQWPPMGEFFFFYLKRDWRLEHAPHTDRSLLSWGYNCNFEAMWGNGLAPAIQNRNVEYQTFATQFYKEALWDLFVTLTKLE